MIVYILYLLYRDKIYWKKINKILSKLIDTNLPQKKIEEKAFTINTTVSAITLSKEIDTYSNKKSEEKTFTMNTTIDCYECKIIKDVLMVHTISLRYIENCGRGGRCEEEVGLWRLCSLAARERKKDEEDVGGSGGCTIGAEGR